MDAIEQLSKPSVSTQLDQPVGAAPIFARIEYQSIEDDILRSVRNAIISGRIELGRHLNESSIARQMAVSRIPIREALKKLEQEGLVTRIANRGVFVVDFDEQDVKEVFSLRSRLEAMAIEWATPKLTAEDLDALRLLIERQQAAVQARDYDELARLDLRFHEYIIIRAGHERLLKSWREIHRQCQVLLNMRFRYMAEFTPDTVPVDHSTIVGAMAAGDVATAVQFTYDISERVQRECAETLRRYREHAA